MGDIALRGNKLTKGRGPHGHGPKPFLNRPGQAQGTHGGKAKGGRIGKFGGGRTNLLEELGRVEAERSNPNRRAEISRVHGELNRGYAKGGRIGLKHGGKPWGTGPKPGTHAFLEHHLHKPRKGKAVGGAVKIGKKFLKFIKTGKDEMTPGVKVNVAKAAERLTGKPHVDHGKRKRIKHLGRGKAEGGRIGKAVGGGLTRRKWMDPLEQIGGSPKGKPHSTKEGRIASGTRRLQRMRQKALNDYHDITWAGPNREKGKPHSSQEGQIATGRRNFKRFLQSRVSKRKAGPGAPSRPGPYIPDPRRKLPKPGERKTVPDPRRKPGEKKEYQPAAKGGRMGFKKGTDKKWMQKVSASIKKRGTKGKCTPITKPGCTGRAKALAKTFKKIAAKNKKA